MSRADYRRWASLRDRQAEGAVLSEHEQLELERLERVTAASQHELAVMRELEQLGSPALDGDERLVAQVLATVSAREKVIPLRGRGAAPTMADSARLGQEPESVSPASVAAARAGHWRGRLLVGGALAAAGAGAFLWQSEASDPPAVASTGSRPAAVELTFTSGKVLVNGKPRVVTALALEPRSTLEVREGRACLAINSRTDVCVDAHSSIALDDQQGSARQLRLLKGRVAAVLKKRPAAESFSIVSGALSATALGTAFSVERGAGGESTVTVLEGHVQVSALGRAETVAAGEQVAGKGDGLGAPRGVTRAELLRHWSLVTARKLWQQPSVGIVHIETQPERAEVTMDGTRLGPTPLSLVAASGSHELLVELGGYQSWRQTFSLTPGQDRRVSAPLIEEARPSQAQVDSPREAPRVPARKAGDLASPQQLLERARALVRQGRWPAAAGAYQRLLQDHPKSPESHTVLVALGQLQLDRLGQPAAALRSFSRYLRVGGGLSQEARFGRIRALRALGNSAGEAAAIREYLARHPGSVDRRTLERRLVKLAGK